MAADEDDEDSDEEGLDDLDEAPDAGDVLGDEFDVGSDDGADAVREAGAEVSAMDEDVPDELAIVDGDDLELHMDDGEGSDGAGPTAAPGIQYVKQRMHSAVRTLTDWKTHGGKDGGCACQSVSYIAARLVVVAAMPPGLCRAHATPDPDPR